MITYLKRLQLFKNSNFSLLGWWIYDYDQGWRKNRTFVRTLVWYDYSKWRLNQSLWRVGQDSAKAWSRCPMGARRMGPIIVENAHPNARPSGHAHRRVFLLRALASKTTPITTQFSSYHGALLPAYKETELPYLCWYCCLNRRCPAVEGTQLIARGAFKSARFLGKRRSIRHTFFVRELLSLKINLTKIHDSLYCRKNTYSKIENAWNVILQYQLRAHVYICTRIHSTLIFESTFLERTESTNRYTLIKVYQLMNN